MSRRWTVVAVAAVVCAASLGVIVAGRQPLFVLAGPQPVLRWATWILAFSAALVAVLAPADVGIRAWTALAASAVLLEEAAGPGAPLGWVMAVGLVASGAHASSAVAAATSIPGARDGRWLHAAAVAVTVTASVVIALLVDPRQRGCMACSSNPIAVDDLPAFSDRVAVASAATVVLVVLVHLVEVTWTALGTERPRRAGIRVALAALAAVTLAAPRLTGGADGAVVGVPRAIGTAALAAFAVSLWWSRIDEVRRRTALVRLVGRVAAAAVPGGIEQSLRTVTGDRGLVLRYRLDDATLIDWTGAVATLPDGAVTALEHNGEVTALLAHTDVTALDRRQIDLISTTAGLALAYEREAAVLAAQLHALAGVRRAVIVSGDLERRALERELHDHAQQRLVSIMIEMRMAAAREPGRLEIEDALVDVQHALDDVRAIAHGIFPAGLGEEGLAGALEELVLESGGRVLLETADLERIEPAVEATAYLIAAHCARSTHDHRVLLRIWNSPGQLELEATVDDASDDGYASLKARTIALGGKWTCDGATLKVQLPCAS